MTLKEKIKQAAKILKSGGVIAFPTETVFGLGASLDSKAAIKKIFKLKSRPATKPLQILVASLVEAKKLGKFNARALKLAKANWPGPLTLVVYKKSKVPKLITGGTDKVGLRVPDHKTALEIIRRAGPLVATSANPSGEKPALSARAVQNYLPGIDFVLPGRVKLGKASKVIDATRHFIALRN